MKETVSVIAAGWSLREIDLARIPGYRIGVNDSAFRTRCNAGVTMDRLWFEGRLAEVWRSFPYDNPGAFYYRAGIDKAGAAPEHWVQFDCDHTSVAMSKDWSPRCRLNGLNSGICGINLAFRMKPARVILWGFDMCRAPDGRVYYHQPYPWAPGGATKAGKYEDWSAHFPSIYAQFAKAGIELVNASPVSKINCVPKIDPKAVLE